MSDSRSVDEIRAEIAAERDGLGQDLDALKSELRSLIPVAVAGIAVIALVTFRKGAMSGARMTVIAIARGVVGVR